MKDWAKCAHFVIETAKEQKTMGCGWSQCGNSANVWCDYKGLSTDVPEMTEGASSQKDLRALLETHFNEFSAKHY